MYEYEPTYGCTWISCALSPAELGRRLSKGLRMTDDLMQVTRDDLEYAQSLFGIDTHLTMASW